MKKFSTVLLASMFLMFCPRASSSLDLAQSDNQFALDLYHRLAVGGRNVFFSPYSLSSALDMTYEGARGKTALTMASVLHLNTDYNFRRARTKTLVQDFQQAKGPCTLSVANALWAQKAYPFKDDYLKMVEDVYQAEARNLDFAQDPAGSRAAINDWVSDHTGHHIRDLLPQGSIRPSTRLVLTDAVYFKGEWAAPFDKNITEPEPFWPDSSHFMRAAMMHLKGKWFYYAENSDVQLLQLPYKGSTFSMFLILPHSKDLPDLEKDLTLQQLKQWQAGMVLERVDISMPKFKFDLKYEMKSILSELGMKIAFDPGQADFSGMGPSGAFFIDQVYHKAWIKVDEEGTEAAAATAVAMRSMAVPIALNVKQFHADHPFIFLIQDSKTGHIIFMGRVHDPTST